MQQPRSRDSAILQQTAGWHVVAGHGCLSSRWREGRTRGRVLLSAMRSLPAEDIEAVFFFFMYLRLNLT